MFVPMTNQIDGSMLERLKCSEDEWTGTRVVLETEPGKIVLFDEFQIEQLTPNPRDNPETADQRRGQSQKRKLVVQSLKDPSAPGLILDEDDKSFLQYLNASEHDSTEHQRKLCKALIIWYDLFFKSGSICDFCFRDNRYRDSRHRSFGDSTQGWKCSRRNKCFHVHRK